MHIAFTIGHDSNNDDDSNGYSSPVPYATPMEKYLNGLLHGKERSRRNVAGDIIA